MEDIPKDLLNLQPPVKGLKAPKLKPKKKSQFHFVLNTNISYKTLIDKDNEFKARLVRTIKYAKNDFIQNINLFLKPNIDDGSKKNVLRSEIALEIGPNKKFLHLDGFIFFDGYCLLDSKKIQSFFNEELKDYTKGTYFNVKYVPDSISNVIEYTRKDGYILI